MLNVVGLIHDASDSSDADVLEERQAQDSVEHRTRRLPRHAVSDKIKTFFYLLFRNCGHFPEAVSLTCFESMPNLLNCM